MKRNYTINEVAKLCHISGRKVRESFDRGQLEGYHLPGSDHRRIPRENVIRFLNNANVSLEYTYFHNANMLLLLCDRPEVIFPLSTALEDVPCRVRQLMDSFSLGCLVQEAMGHFCWAVVDMTLPKLDIRHVGEEMIKRGWQVFLLNERNQRGIKGIADVFYFPLDPALLAARLRSYIGP